ncbi:blood group Rh(CE) polypeptide isoform X2 [Myotis yumanensis]|uniref:blood group Rh(CE) polypeptide isoform X2 n=1 Tax=Myotis yumanensis TaxID=159337 RepID=UPI0038D018EB
MGSKYPRSMRGCLPLWTLILEAALIVIFFFFANYDSSSKDPKKIVVTHGAILQDVVVMAALGMGFLTSSLWRYGWSSVAFNLFMLALGVQWAVLLDGFLEHPPSWKVVIKLSRIQQATMSAMSALISVGAILGKANLAQLVLMVLMEVTAFSAMRMISRQFLVADNHVSMMYIHVFAAYFGLTVAWCFSRPLPKEAEEKEQRTTSPSLFAMLGTLFLWMFWPSFNSALLTIPHERKNGVFNTYYALAVSAVTAISLSALTHPQGKISMVCFNRMLGIHDTCGVHYTFGLPGLLGGITYIGLMVHKISWSKNSMLGFQVLFDTGVLSLSMAMGLASGLITGLILNLKIWKAPHVAKYFDDQAFWEFPHLAVGF